MTKKNKEIKGPEANKDSRKKKNGATKAKQNKNSLKVRQNGVKQTVQTAQSVVIRPLRSKSNFTSPINLQNKNKGFEPIQVFDLTRENFPPLNVSPPTKSTPVAGLRVIMETAHVAIDSGPDLKAHLSTEGDIMAKVNDRELNSGGANVIVRPNQN